MPREALSERLRKRREHRHPFYSPKVLAVLALLLSLFAYTAYAAITSPKPTCLYIRFDMNGTQRLIQPWENSEEYLNYWHASTLTADCPAGVRSNL